MMEEHYQVKKDQYNPNKIEEVMDHCIQDVEYTKKLYEERNWKVPILERRNTKQRWKNRYDDDISGVIWDGEQWTYLSDFGNPKYMVSARDFFDDKLPKTIICPLCDKEEISLYPIYKMDTDEITCKKCGGLIVFQPGSNLIFTTYTKKELHEKVCPNCTKQLLEKGYDHYGYGAGHGEIIEGRSICPACKGGCYDWEDDNTPGFRDHYKGNCCSCGIDVGQFLIDEYNKNIMKDP
jgi:hypothetical protein